MNHKVSEKAYKGMGMEGLTARWYTSLTYKSLDEFKALAGRAARQSPPAPAFWKWRRGPATLPIRVAKLGTYRVTGLDISRTLVEIAAPTR